MTCYLCSAERKLFSFGKRYICAFCKLRMEKVREKMNISSQHWRGKEIMLDKQKIEVMKIASKLRSKL